MWEGSFPSRTSESVFSWKLVAGFTAQLIDKREYFINTSIKPFVPKDPQQLTFFDLPAQPADAPLFSHPKLPQQIIDEALCVGANDEHSRLIICAYFMKDKPDNAAFLQRHYGENGAGFYFDGERISLWYDAEGMRIARGTTAQRSNATLLSWEEAAKRIRELLDLGRYMPQSELDEVEHYERMQLADSIAYTSRDITKEARETGFLPLTMLTHSVKGGYPEVQKQIYGLLCEPDTLQNAWMSGERSTMRWTPGKTCCVSGATVRKRYCSGSVTFSESRCILPLPTGLLPTGSFLFPPTRSTRCCVRAVETPTTVSACTLLRHPQG